MEDIKEVISPVIFINQNPTRNPDASLMHSYPFINAMYSGVSEIDKEDKYNYYNQIDECINYFLINNYREMIVTYLLKFTEEYKLWSSDEVELFIQSKGLNNYTSQLFWLIPKEESEIDNYLLTDFDIPCFNTICGVFEDFIQYISTKYVLSSESFNNDLFAKLFKLTYGDDFDYFCKEPSFKYEFTCNILREMSSKYLLNDIKLALNLMKDSIKNMILMYLNSSKSENDFKQIMAGLMIESKHKGD